MVSYLQHSVKMTNKDELCFLFSVNQAQYERNRRRSSNVLSIRSKMWFDSDDDNFEFSISQRSAIVFKRTKIITVHCSRRFNSYVRCGQYKIDNR